MPQRFDETRYVSPRINAATSAMNTVANATVSGLTRLGLSLYGSRVLVLRGRTSGLWRSTPVNLLTKDGERYLVAPRGHTQWVRNLRAAGEGWLRLGRQRERFVPTELGDDEKPPIMRAYLHRWAWETRAFLDGVDADTPVDELRQIAPGFPVFRVEQP